MIYVACLELAVIVVLVVLNARERRTHDQAVFALIKQGEHERLELVQHIKRPEYVTPVQRTGEPQAKPDPNLAKIGTFAPRESEAA